MSNPIVKCRYTELKDADSLTQHPKNPNRHPKEQVERIARVIELNGWRQPIVVSKLSGFITKGHGRLQAALLRGWKQVPVEIQEYKNEAEEYADIIADNKLSSMSRMDKKMVDEIIDSIDGADVEAFGYVNDDFAVDDAEGSEAKAVSKVLTKFNVVIESKSEADQKKIYEELAARGLTCYLTSK